MFILGCLLRGILQTLDKSDLVPRTGGQTVLRRLSDDGSPAGSCRVMENFLPLPSLQPCQKLEIPSGHTAASLNALPATKTLLPALPLGTPGPTVPCEMTDFASFWRIVALSPLLRLSGNVNFGRTTKFLNCFCKLRLRPKHAHLWGPG